ncbi:helix-turn-helix domain-containing protein [Novosphingobium sp. FGD1]|uniref:Helix-turn-helix domain-containing protein n=1 Tax=Novosphingobium silvae TaxID=2692619 RepID=A0A7X4K6D9_9SPHN|nr:S24 family peptidase [Novosphingobium silvae]MYL97060.1 helix-turn-helix domain-containing protein [Novosphingobium silvae]
MAANNIAAFRKQRGLSQTELAERVGTTLNMLGKLERGDRSLDQAWLDKIGSALGVAPHELIAPDITEKKLAPVAVITPAAEDVVYIQKLDLSLSMGPGTHIEDWVEAEPVPFGLDFIRTVTRTSSDRLKLVTGIGDSMYPTLNWGDVILIDTTERQLARQDAVYWIDLYGAAGLKRLRTVGPGRVLVVSDNPNVPDQEVDAADLRIQGRAIWLARGI